MTRLEAAVAEFVDALRSELAPAPAPQPDRLLNVVEAAALLGTSRTTVFREIAEGRLRSFRVGGKRRISTGAIAAYIAERDRAD